MSTLSAPLSTPFSTSLQPVAAPRMASADSLAPYTAYATAPYATAPLTGTYTMPTYSMGSYLPQVGSCRMAACPCRLRLRSMWPALHTQATSAKCERFCWLRHLWLANAVISAISGFIAPAEKSIKRGERCPHLVWSAREFVDKSAPVRNPQSSPEACQKCAMWREALELPRLDEVSTAGAISACEKGQKRQEDAEAKRK